MPSGEPTKKRLEVLLWRASERSANLAEIDSFMAHKRNWCFVSDRTVLGNCDNGGICVGCSDKMCVANAEPSE